MPGGGLHRRSTMANASHVAGSECSQVAEGVGQRDANSPKPGRAGDVAIPKPSRVRIPPFTRQVAVGTLTRRTRRPTRDSSTRSGMPPSKIRVFVVANPALWRVVGRGDPTPECLGSRPLRRDWFESGPVSAPAIASVGDGRASAHLRGMVYVETVRIGPMGLIPGRAGSSPATPRTGSQSPLGTPSSQRCRSWPGSSGGRAFV